MTESIDDIVRQALFWVYTINDLAQRSPEQTARFNQWITSSPEHTRQFLLANAYYIQRKKAGLMQPGDAEQFVKIGKQIARFRKWPPVVSIGDMAGRSAAPGRSTRDVLEAFQKPLRWVGGHWRRVAVVTFAAFLVTTAATYFSRIGRIWKTEGTGSTVHLNDGSVLSLDANSIAEVRNTSSAREVTLRKGKGTFDVAHSATRPFRVSVAGGAIQVLGTRFSVSIEETGATVEVQEGKVRVKGRSSSEDLGPGQSALIRTDGSLRLGAHYETIEGMPLGRLVALINERGNQPRIDVQGKACLTVVSGQWDLNRVDDFLRWVEIQGDLKAVPTDSGMRVRMKGDLAPAEPGGCEAMLEANAHRP